MYAALNLLPHVFVYLAFMVGFSTTARFELKKLWPAFIRFQPFDCRWCAQYVPNIFFNVLGCEWNVQLHVPILSDELTLQFNSQLEIHIFLGEKPQFLRLKSTFLQVGIPIFAGPFRSTFAPSGHLQVRRWRPWSEERREFCHWSHPQLWQKWIVWNIQYVWFMSG